jgi:hypothetical protein
MSLFEMKFVVFVEIASNLWNWERCIAQDGIVCIYGLN